MVEAGMGVALVPRMAAGRREGVLTRPLGADRPRRHVLAAVRRGSESAPGVARVLDALREVAAERTA
jgi:DNA-binding transcriptional LysR family regulator